MNNKFSEGLPHAPGGDKAEVIENFPPENKPNFIAHWLDSLLQMGLGESVLRLGTNLMSLVLVFVVIGLMRSFYRNMPASYMVRGALSVAPTATPSFGFIPIPLSNITFQGISRLASLHTIIPSRPRIEIEKYTVQPGDTVFGIAEKYGLKPQTILWGNYNTLYDNPHFLTPDQELIIMPVDGIYYEWQAGDGLNGVAKGSEVKPEDIINFPGNHLNPDEIGDYTHPNIEPGTWLIIPGGTRGWLSWSAPIGLTRENPATPAIMGPGACDPFTGGAVGYGTFVWPANKHYLSGFDYSPETNHRGIDIAGNLGEGAYATDAGVVVYAGWNPWGYGNVVMIDHGTGFQSLYAHLNEIYVGCGQSVGQGDPIGAIGSTGRSSGAHLHFELMTSIYGKVNPWDFLPPP
jgi:hypothetical protein